MSKAPVFEDVYSSRTRDRFVQDVGGPSATKQEFIKECDINNIMKRYESQGILPVGVSNASYGDFADAVDYHASLNLLISAKAQFDSLPSKVRERFKNDPEEFLKFVGDKNNLEEAHDLGLLSAVAASKVVEGRAKKAADKAAADKVAADKAAGEKK